MQARYQLGPGQGGPVNTSYTVPAEGRRTIHVNGPEGVGAGKDVSVYLFAESPFLAERPMYCDHSGMGGWSWTGGHYVIGAAQPADEWFFADGYTGDDFEEWLCIQNYSASPTEVTITYYPEGGGDSIVKAQPTIPGRSRYTVYVNSDAGEDLSISAEVVADKDVVVERPMYFNYNGLWTGGHDVLGFAP